MTTTLSDAPREVSIGVPKGAAVTGDVHVLIVEDDDADACLITRALQDNPRIRSIVRAVDGVDALELIANGFEPDIAIIDLRMPRKTGFSLLLDLSCAEWTFPKIVLTSSKVREDTIRSKLRGATQVLIKPNSFGDLEKLLGAALCTA
jgi:CheY-like chemotaxis protein